MVTGRLYVKNDYWYCIINLKEADGTRKQKWISTGLKRKGNKKAAEEILLQLRQEHTTMFELTARSKGIFFHEYMLTWLMDMENRVAKSTFISYSDIVKKQIAPYFKEQALMLVSLKPWHIEQYYNYLLAQGLSANTVLHHHANIHKALKEANKRELIAYNPAALVDRPRKTKFIPLPYSQAETISLLKNLKGDLIELPVLLAIFYGLRRSEIAGLRWQDVDFEKDILTIRHSLQSRSLSEETSNLLAQNILKRNMSFRTMPLVSEIKDLFQQYGAQHKQTRGKQDYVFRMPDNSIMKPSYISARFSKLLAKNELRHIRFHDLRHSCASMLIAQRVPLIEVQQWLGHSNISTTADMYAHLDYSTKVRSAKTLNKQLFTPQY